MAKQIINIGAAPNDGQGDPIRTAFDKANENFTELYAGAGGGGNVDSVNGETGVVVLDGTDIPLLPNTTAPTVTDSIAAKIDEAPNDGKQYGRQS